MLRRFMKMVGKTLNSFETIEINSGPPDLNEQLGTKEKYWFRINNDPYLFKIGRANTGENWSEK